MQQQMLMLMEGTELKERGQKEAIEHTEAVSPLWTERTLEALRRFCAGMKQRGVSTFTLEDFKATRFHDLPVSHNAWGALPGLAVKLGIIRDSGQYKKSLRPNAHARVVKVWEII